MNIVHVSVGSLPPVFSSSGGAIQRRVRELARAQRRRGHEVSVVSPSDGSLHRSKTTDIPVKLVNTRVPPPLSHVEYQLRAIYGLARAAAPPDVLHFHSEPEAGILSLRIPSLRVLSYDNFYFRRGKQSPLFRLYRHALRTFDLLLPCSEHCAKASAEYWGLPTNAVRVLYNGVNLEQFRPDPEGARRERERIGLSGPVALYLGRVCRQKGVDVLLAAWQTVRSIRPDAELVIAGPIEQFGTVRANGEWEQKIRAIGGRYIGQVTEPRLSGLLTMADVFVMPTIALEMFGMAAVEAQACGTPVVATDHGGLKETVPKTSGIRVRPGDPVELGHALLRVLGDTRLRSAYAQAALAHANRFGWDQIADDLDASYQTSMYRMAKT